MSTTMMGEISYTLKDIQFNTSIMVNKLRNSINKGNLKPSGKTQGSYYVIQSELDKYLKLWTKSLDLDQTRLANHMLGLNKIKKNRLPYRNYFYSSSSVEPLEELVEVGLATKCKGWQEGHIYYFLTKECIEIILKKEISEEEFVEI